MIVKSYFALNLRKRPVFVVRRDFIMEAEKQPLKLRNDDVLVISRVTDDRSALLRIGELITRKVLRAWVRRGTGQGLAEQKVTPILIQVGLVVWSATIHAVQVEARRSKVLQTFGVILLLEAAGRIKGEVMVDELAEICVGGRNSALFIIGSVLRVLRLGNHLVCQFGQGGQRLLVIVSKVGRWQCSEYPAK